MAGNKKKSTTNIDAFRDGDTSFGNKTARIPSDLEKVTDPKTGEVYYREKLSTFRPVRKA